MNKAFDICILTSKILAPYPASTAITYRFRAICV
jgi:hypothetical protein